jgi:hypothetical protein
MIVMAVPSAGVGPKYHAGKAHTGLCGLQWAAQRHVLELVPPWIGRRTTLGVWIAPAGTWKDEFDYRQAQSRELALQMAGAVLPRETARTGYYMMVRPKLEYPLTVTQFTQTECDQRITSPVIDKGLSIKDGLPLQLAEGSSVWTAGTLRLRNT